MAFTNRKSAIRSGLGLLLITILILSGCSRTNEGEPPLPDNPTPPPMATPTLAAERVVLVRPADSDPLAASQADSLLRELAAGSGLEFETRESLINNEVTPDVRVVVFLRKPDNLGSLAAGAPGVQFLAITGEDWNPTPNISLIRLREEHTAFMAGYLAAMLAPNYRVGALLAAEKAAFNSAFINGVYYYCGMCGSEAYPLVQYPLTTTLPAGSPFANWQASFSEMNVNKVNVLYVADEAASPELFTYLSSQDVALIGSQSPPEEGKPRWVVTISADGISPIRDIWADLMAGNGGKTLNATLNFSDNMFIGVNEGLVWLSEGKFNYALETIRLLRDGKINPLPVN